MLGRLPLRRELILSVPRRGRFQPCPGTILFAVGLHD